MVKELTFEQLKEFCPRSYQSLTLGDYQKIFSQWGKELQKQPYERNYNQLFCILTGAKLVKETPEIEAAIYELIRWVNDEPFRYSKEVPETITIDYRKITVPKDIGKLSVGQNIVLQQCLEKSSYIEEQLSMAIAIYLQPLYTGTKFSMEKTLEFEKLISELPAKDVYGLGFFLLMHAANNGWQRLNAWQQILTNLKQQLRKMWPRWRMPGASSVSLTYPSQSGTE